MSPFASGPDTGTTNLVPPPPAPNPMPPASTHLNDHHQTCVTGGQGDGGMSPISPGPQATHLPPPGLTRPSTTTSSNSSGSPLAPAFVDHIANIFAIGDADRDLRQLLHVFMQIGLGLLRADLATRIFMVALLLCILREVRQFGAVLNNLQLFMEDLRHQWDSNFTCNSEQRAIIRIMANDMMFNPNRVAFTELHFDVISELEKNEDDFRFKNVFKNPARHAVVRALTKEIASSVRNGFRENVRDSVIGPKAMTLQDHVVHMTSRFKRGGIIPASELSLVTARLAILRRFALENPHVLNRAEPVAVDEPEDHSDGHDESEDPVPSPAQTRSASTSKRKRASTVTAPKKGEHFWAQVQDFFSARHASWTRRWDSPQWQAYIKQTLEMDYQRFKPAPVINAYMSDPNIDIESVPATAGASATGPGQFQVGSLASLVASMGGVPGPVDVNHQWSG
ncbi:hypothetical protein BXZ70DRAFT_1012565 [Cristinia sonorae]|uniref:Uncharacterized protein n=1 Tax=Cristinia sonorae TaxID=1940300 RepID=A0A8K0XK86_9AGAR|nr:hypothetical protein BXZ70DRAFT_1012565 [Cristinia sonorae]